MTLPRIAFHIGVSLLVAPIPAILALAYLNRGDQIPLLPGLLLVALCAAAYLFWAFGRSGPGEADSPATAPRADEIGSEAPQMAKPMARARTLHTASAAEKIAERKRQNASLKSFQDIPDPLSRGERSDPLDLLNHRLDDLRQLKRLLADHRVTLLNQWYRNVRRDVFGGRDLSDWAYEADRFLLSTGFSPRTLNRHEAIANLTADIEQIAESQGAGNEGRKPRTSTRSLAFHQRCAITLQRHGWATHVAAEPRSDGIDIFAEYDDTIVGLHCRIYTHPVGEDVLEQLMTAAQYYCLDSAAVVSPSGYTSGARRLATANRVALLDRDDLPQLRSYVRDPRKVVTLSRHRAMGGV